MFFSLNNRPFTGVVFLVLIFFSCLTSADEAPKKILSPMLALSAKASLEGREKCQRLMHEDAVEFQKCASQWIAKLPAKTNEDRYFKLGASYYAWLSSTSALKNGMPKAEESAFYFLRIFRPLQKKLKVSDQDLCPTIEGDCTSRVARLLVMESELQSAGKKTVNSTGAVPSAN